MKKLILVVATVLAVAACSMVQPIRNGDNVVIQRFDRKPLSLEQVNQAIYVAAASRGWKTQSVAPGHDVLTLDHGILMAAVDVYYTPAAYRIRYKDSRNMSYSAATQTVHKHYNFWIRNREASINAAVQQLRIGS